MQTSNYFAEIDFFLYSRARPGVPSSRPMRTKGGKSPFADITPKPL